MENMGKKPLGYNRESRPAAGLSQPVGRLVHGAGSLQIARIYKLIGPMACYSP
jgi:hypothetical protein